MTVKDDDIPEVDEIFHIRLLTVASTDGSQGPTNTSGASIDLSKSSSVFTIVKNDHSNGVLQFSNRTHPPSPDEGILPVATEEPTVSLNNNIRPAIGIKLLRMCNTFKMIFQVF